MKKRTCVKAVPLLLLTLFINWKRKDTANIIEQLNNQKKKALSSAEIPNHSKKNNKNGKKRSTSSINYETKKFNHLKREDETSSNFADNPPSKQQSVDSISATNNNTSTGEEDVNKNADIVVTKPPMKITNNSDQEDRSSFSLSEIDSFPYYNFTDTVQRYNLARSFYSISNSSNNNNNIYKYLSSMKNYSWCTMEGNENNDSDESKSRSNRKGGGERGKQQTGLLYNKVPKAASSTTAGISLRIADRVANRLLSSSGSSSSSKNNYRLSSSSCNVQVYHHPNYSVGRKYKNRIKDKSFLFTSIRNPTKRAISRIYFTSVSQRHRKATDSNMLDWLINNTDSQFGTVSPGMGGFQLPYISLNKIEEFSSWTQEEPITIRNHSYIIDNVRNIIQNDYDFIIITERFDESIVALSFILNLPLSDLLYLSASKSSSKASSLSGSNSNNYFFVKDRNKCILIKPSKKLSPSVQSFVQSKQWASMNYGDYLLIEAANQSLDQTIDSIGKEKFHNSLKEFQLLQKYAQRKCNNNGGGDGSVDGDKYYSPIFPCSSDGKPQYEKSKFHCYEKDWGCGYPCLNNITTLIGGANM